MTAWSPFRSTIPPIWWPFRVETYTAKRAYQIAFWNTAGAASPVVMGGFHATLVSGGGLPIRRGDRAVTRPRSRLASKWSTTPATALLKAPLSCGHDRHSLAVRSGSTARSFAGKRYLPLRPGRDRAWLPLSPANSAPSRLLLSGQTHRRRPVDEIVAELVEIRHQRKLFFFVDGIFAG